MGIAISTHLPPPVMIESTEVRRWVTHMLCWSCGMYFSAAASSEKDHCSMNLDSNTASVPSTSPSRVATIHAIAECLTRRCTSRTRRPVLRSYQERLSSSVAAPSCTMRLPDRSSGSASPRFSCQRRTRAASSLPMMILASEPPMNERRYSCGFVHTPEFMTSSDQKMRSASANAPKRRDGACQNHGKSTSLVHALSRCDLRTASPKNLYPVTLSVKHCPVNTSGIQLSSLG